MSAAEIEMRLAEFVERGKHEARSWEEADAKYHFHIGPDEGRILHEKLRRLAALEKVYRCASAVMANVALGADGGCAIDELGEALKAAEEPSRG